MPFKVFYGICYGGFVAGAYLLIRVFGTQGGLNIFALSTAVAFVAHLLLWPRQTVAGLLDHKMVIRGVLYGLTQVLIFKAQAHGQTSAALVASTMGSVFGVILGRFFLGERLRGAALVAAGFCFTACFIDPLIIVKSYWGLAGGLIQGIGFVLARSLMLTGKSPSQSISTGFCLASIVGFVTLFLSGEIASASQINLRNLVFITIVVVLIQYAFFQLYRALDSQRASMLLLSRIPWALALEFLLFGAVIAAAQLASSILIAFGALLLLLEAQFARLFKLTRQKT